ncbi:hypothetical protein AAFA31_20650 [Klebsiella michiganensis]|uniref:hypothetical protein n=1 Tax=Klebsiella michiganensis TaxID=1134687 RepID=UPI000515C5F6|nr:hypothetical protein [Klebsiella michiganensis]
MKTLLTSRCINQRGAGQIRDAAGRELGHQYSEGLSQEVYDREDWLDTQLATISPIHQQEAIDVLKWLLKSDRHEGRDEMDAILMNLIGKDYYQ